VIRLHFTVKSNL